MSAAWNVPLELDAALLRRTTDARLQRLPHRQALLGEVLAAMSDERLLQPALAYRVHPAALVPPPRSAAGDAGLLTTRQSSTHMAVLVCTIGPALEKKVASYFASQKPMLGLLLDEVGSIALRHLCQEALDRISREASSRAMGTGPPLSPGDAGWPLADCSGPLWTATAGEIGVTFTSAGMMSPRKSVSMAVGLGPALPPARRFEPCGACCRRSGCKLALACAG